MQWGRGWRYEKAASRSLWLQKVGVGHGCASRDYGLEGRALWPGSQIFTSPVGARAKVAVVADAMEVVGGVGRLPTGLWGFTGWGRVWDVLQGLWPRE